MGIIREGGDVVPTLVSHICKRKRGTTNLETLIFYLFMGYTYVCTCTRVFPNLGKVEVQSLIIPLKTSQKQHNIVLATRYDLLLSLNVVSGSAITYNKPTAGFCLWPQCGLVVGSQRFGGKHVSMFWGKVIST